MRPVPRSAAISGERQRWKLAMLLANLEVVFFCFVFFQYDVSSVLFFQLKDRLQKWLTNLIKQIIRLVGKIFLPPK